MDLNGIKQLLTSMSYTAEFLRQLQPYEKFFLIERAEELGIKGMEEFLNKEDFSSLRKGKAKQVLEIETGIIYNSIKDLAKAKNMDNSCMGKIVKANPKQYQYIAMK